MQRNKPGWMLPMADVVYKKVHVWFTCYENGMPQKQRAVPHPERGTDDMVLVVPSYRHDIMFRLNELNWLEQVLDYATQELEISDPKRVVYSIIKKGREQHEMLQDKKKIAIGVEYPTKLDFQKSHVQWVYNTLSQHKMGRLAIEVDSKKATEEITKADW